MNVEQILAAARSRFLDNEEPQQWAFDDMMSFLNQAEREAAERAKLIEDYSTVAVCNIAGLVSVAQYTLHAKIIEVISVRWNGRLLDGISRRELDRRYCRQDWTTLTGQPTHFIDPQEKYLTLHRTPTTAAAIKVGVYRYPLNDMTGYEDTPEIAEQYHFWLIDWMEFLAYSTDDTEIQDIPRATAAAGRFTARFGEKIDSNTRRTQRDRTRNHVCFNPNW